MNTQSQDMNLEPGRPLRVLHIDDDEKYCSLVGQYLERHGYSVTAVHDGKTGYERIVSEHWDGVLLDIKLPDVDGLMLLQQIRAVSQVPVLMLTALTAEPERVDGLQFGADDSLMKIASLRELQARIEAVLRRSRERHPCRNVLRFGRLRIYPESQRTLVDKVEIRLTELEFAILLLLARSRGSARSRDELVAGVTNRPDAGRRMVDVHVFALRKKLAEASDGLRYIRTVRNVGYMLVDPDITP